jgi:hypothetical protein
MQVPKTFIPEFPFTELYLTNPNPGQGYEVTAVANPDDLTTRLTCGMQLGYATSSSGLTGAGLYNILNGMFVLENSRVRDLPNSLQLSEKFVFGKNFFKVTSGSSHVIVIRDLTTLLANLDILHNNIATLISDFDDQNAGYIANGGDQTYFPATDGLIFNNLKNYIFPNSYPANGYTDVTNQKNPSAPRGNGITGAFVIWDQGSSQWQLSRAGVELTTLVNYLSYGGIAVVAPSWTALNNFRNTNAPRNATETGFNSFEFDVNGDFIVSDYVGNIECAITLDMGGALERRGITSGDNRDIYAGLQYTYATGNSFGFAYGLTASQITNLFSAPLARSTFFNTLYASPTAVYKDVPVIHAGLSGASISLEQNTLTSDLSFTDVHRYPGLNGLESLRPTSTSSAAGLTSYTLTTEDLDKLICVIGKKHKIVNSTYFGDPLKGNQIDLVTPLVGDVAGLLQKNKQNSEVGLYGPPIGPVNGRIANASFIEPSIDPSPDNSVATLLRSKKINFVYEDVNAGYFLATELVGATASITGNIDANSRFGIAWLKRAVRRDVASYLQGLVDSGTFVNNESNRSLVVKNITPIVQGYANPYFDPNYTPIIQCDGSNNSNNSTTLTVSITVKPKSVVYQYQGPSPSTSVNTFTLSITAVGAAYGK